MDDVFAAGVEPGGLKTSQEIKILLCYMLHTVGQPIHRDEITDIIVAGGMANYFDTEEAIEDLLRLQHLIQTEERLLAPTVTGSQIGDSLSVRVPYTLRERSVKAALELLKRRQIEKDNKVDIRKDEDGGVTVVCTVEDRGRPLMQVTLPVADQWQAEQIREQFLTDPAMLYKGVLGILTGDGEIKRAGTQLVIRLS